MNRVVVIALLCTSALARADVPPAAPPLATPPGLELANALLACHKLPADKRLRLTLHGDVGPAELVAALAPLACRPIVLAGGALRSGKVTVEAPDLLSPSEATRLIIAALDSLGLTLEESGASYRVVDSVRGREIATMVGDGQHAKASEAFVVRMVHLNDASPDDVAATLAKLRSKEGDVVPLAQSRSVLIIDRASLVERMEAMAHALDHPAIPQRMFVLPTNRQKPSELVDAVEKIVLAGTPRGGDKGDAGRPVLLPVDSARAILMAGNEAAYRRAEALLARIDPPLMAGEEQGSRIAVIYLKHVGAEDIATTLKEVLTQSRQRTTGPGVAGGVAPPPAFGSTATSGSSAIDGEVRITADKLSNSLVVTGAATDLESVRNLVARLDLPRRQVYVEATILDLSADLSRSLGIALHQGMSSNGTTGFVASENSSTNSLVVDASTLSSALGGGLLAGVLGKSFNLAGTSIPSFGVMLQAVESSRDASVLSRPYLLTMDHMRATLTVGQMIPFPSGTLGTTTGSASTLALQTTYVRQPVQLKMDLTPHLTDEQEIRLEIEGEIDDVVANTTSAGGPTTNQRTIKTTVMVGDGESVVLGGLQKDSTVDSVEKIPGLGDIPVIGRIFQSKSKSHTKQELLIILTPYIIRDASDLRRIYEQKDNERREFQRFTTKFTTPGAYEARVDFGRKRGLLEEINRTAQRSEDEAVAIAHARTSLGARRPILAGEITVEPQAPKVAR